MIIPFKEANTLGCVSYVPFVCYFLFAVFCLWFLDRGICRNITIYTCVSIKNDNCV